MEYFLLKNSNDYQIVVNNYYYESESFLFNEDTVYIDEFDITVNKNQAYSYEDIDPLDFLNFINDYNNLGLDFSNLRIIAVKNMPYTSEVSVSSIVGSNMIYVFENGDGSTMAYAYTGILKRDGQYFCVHMNNLSNRNWTFSFTLNQEFLLTHPVFSEPMAKSKWDIEHYVDWFNLNTFDIILLK